MHIKVEVERSAIFERKKRNMLISRRKNTNMEEIKGRECKHYLQASRLKMYKRTWNLME